MGVENSFWAGRLLFRVRAKTEVVFSSVSAKDSAVFEMLLDLESEVTTGSFAFLREIISRPFALWPSTLI